MRIYIAEYCLDGENYKYGGAFASKDTAIEHAQQMLENSRKEYDQEFMVIEDHILSKGEVLIILQNSHTRQTYESWTVGEDTLQEDDDDA